MRKRAILRAMLIFFAVSIAAASTRPAAAQVPFSAQTYEQLLRPLKYLKGRMSPYVLEKADFFGGIDAAKTVTFVWAGATYSPWGTLIEDGWRVRFIGAGGLYTYQTPIVPGGINDVNVYSAELLGGYRKTFQDIFGATVYVGAYAGVLHETQLLNFADPFNPAQGGETGLKGSLEFYTRMFQHYVVTGFASASSVHNKYHVKGTALRDLTERWAVGGEIATMGDARYSEHRLGVVGALTLDRRIFMLSVGALENSGRGNGIYTTLSVYSPF